MDAHGHTEQVRTRLLAALASASFVTAIVVPAATAEAVPAPAQQYVACSWQVGERDRTLACGGQFAKAGAVQFSQCWRYRPVGAQVYRKVGTEWKRTTLKVRAIGNASSCDRKTPWRSLVAVDVTSRHPDQVTNYQLILPATDKYRRTTVNFATCTVKVGTTKPCA